MRRMAKRVVGGLAILVTLIDWVGRIQTVGSLVPFLKDLSLRSWWPWLDPVLILIGFAFLWWAKKPDAAPRLETGEQRIKRLARELKKCVLAELTGMGSATESGLRVCLKRIEAADNEFEPVVSELEDQGFLQPMPHHGGERWWLVKPPSPW